MNRLEIKISTSNYATAEVNLTERGTVNVDIASNLEWDAAGLEELAEILLGTARLLPKK